MIASQPVAGGSVFSENHAKFLSAPRLGIAWSPFSSKKTVIRGGFGVYHALLDNLSYRLDQNGPFNSVSAVKNIAFSNIVPGATFATSRVIPSGVQPDLRTPTIESWSLKVEQQISTNTSFSVGYVGSHGYHELLSLDANLPAATICPEHSHAKRSHLSSMERRTCGSQAAPASTTVRILSPVRHSLPEAVRAPQAAARQF